MIQGNEGALRLPDQTPNRASASYIGLKQRELIRLAFGMVLLGVIFALVFTAEPLWLAAGLAFSVFVIVHIALTAERYIILPGLMSLVACINWVVAPWLAYHFPPSFGLFSMEVPPEPFFAFAVPATIALWLGAHLAMKSGLPTAHAPQTPMPLTKREQRFMDGLIVFALSISMLSTYLPQPLAFFYYILSQLSFVGALAWMLSGTRGWVFRVAFVYLHLLVEVAGGGVFYEFILWSGYLLICMAYLRRWRARLVAALLAALILGGVLNSIKSEYRGTIAVRNLDGFEQVQILGELLWNAISGTDKAKSSANFGDSVVRFNQGWIMSRVMSRVPNAEPYANGQTVLSAVVASVVPRVFFPDKEVVGSRNMFAKFAGIQLNEHTQMTIGIAGEMYANFGPLGGVFAVFIYGYLVGWMFNGFARIAYHNPLWWAWVPFVMIAAIESDWNLVDILNYIVKSLIILWLVIRLFAHANVRLFRQNTICR